MSQDKEKDLKVPSAIVVDDKRRDPTMVVFVIKSKGQRDDKVLKFHKSRLVIGSVISADIRLVGEGVAPIHAVLEVDGSSQLGVAGSTIYDLGSDTGLFVNGSKVVTKSLRSGDEITVGHYKLVFSLDDISKISHKERVRESAGRKLFWNPHEDLAPLLLQEEREVEEIFDYRSTHKQSLEVVMSWKGTILNVNNYVNQKTVTIGNSRKCDFGVPPMLSSARYPIVKKVGTDYFLNFDSTMKGVLQNRGVLRTLDQVRAQSTPGPVGYTIAFSKNDFAKITVGEVDFYLSFTAAPPTLKMARTFERDPLFFKILISSMLLTVVTIIALKNTNVPQIVEAEQLPERIATILYQPEKYVHKKRIELPRPKPVEMKAVEPKPIQTPKQPKVTKLNITPKKANEKKPIPKVISTQTKATIAKANKKGQDQAKEGEGARAKGKEGTRGAPKAPKGAEHQTKAMRPSPEGGHGQGSGNSQVADHGNVDLLKGASSKIQNLLGNSAVNMGKGGEKLRGFGGFTTLGTGGLALSGDGKGGGGDAATLGGLSNKGRGGGRVGTGLGAAGTGSGIIGGKTRVVIRSGGPEEAVVMGAIDADAVEAALLAHKDEFRLCYEKEINAEVPNLAGRVGTSFVIGPSGRVAQTGIESTTLKNANVERCLLTVIKRIDFPIPRGGGIVQVTYPFKFSSLKKEQI